MTNKIKLNKEPDNWIGKSETLHHTFREQKLDVEKESHTKIQIKPENKIYPPPAHKSLWTGLLWNVPHPHFRQLENEKRQNLK